MNQQADDMVSRPTGRVDLEQLLARINGTAGGPTDSPPVAPAPSAPAATAEVGREERGVGAARVVPPGLSTERPFPPPFAIITNDRDEPFVPKTPASLQEAEVTESIVEEIILRYLLARGEATGRMIANQLKLPFLLIEPILERLKYEQLTAYRGATTANDYIHVLTDFGRERARSYVLRTTYFGAAPVSLDDYRASVKLQTVESQNPKRDDLLRAFSDLLIDASMLDRLGPAINSGRGMFLFGFPGNGKTSIAERITAAFGKYIWIPRAISIDGEIMRVYDPLVHEAVEVESRNGLLDESHHDRRWVRIKRPTVVAGGELTMEMLEPQLNPDSKIYEAPLQMKSNCGVLLIDDFGRQRMSVDELLNRWIVPLEKRYDFLNTASGKKTQVPFDQLVVFSTNLQPKDLVDDAFLRRIPYKIEVKDPSEQAFRKLFEIMCPKFGLPYKPEIIDYLIDVHYKRAGRPLRNCHPRDLLLQVRNYCLYQDRPLDLTREYIDFAVENYFSIM